MAKSKYQVNLPQHHAECDLNYARLGKLTASEQDDDRWAYRIENQLQPVILRVVDEARYTTTLKVEQPSLADWAKGFSLTVRMYHDARMAEVIAWERQRGFRGHYDYPNQAMFQRDEKAQLNRFLGDWLKHCLAHGRMEEVITLR